MTKDREQKRPRTQGALPDQHLWTKVAQTVEPIKKTRFSDLVAEELKNCAPLPKPVKPKKPEANRKPAFNPAPVRQPPPVVPPISSLDRRTRQKLTRGNVDIEGRLDLHGTGVEMARVKLKGFLTAARAAEKRTVLVITGKGCSPFARHTLHGAGHFDAPERMGRLRRLVPQWLEEPEFRVLVAGFQPAHPRHGGGGAFYIRLRRVRAP
ncbi:MAG: Smr/MutS family protein [Hyphomicrobiales bacterium]